MLSDVERKESLNETKKEVGVSSTETKPQNQTHEDKAHPKSQQGKALKYCIKRHNKYIYTVNHMFWV